MAEEETELDVEIVIQSEDVEEPGARIASPKGSQTRKPSSGSKQSLGSKQSQGSKRGSKSENITDTERGEPATKQEGSSEEKDEEFRFYLQFVKSLVFHIQDLNVRGAVSSWILKLQKANSQSELRAEYIKLLLFCLQRKKLHAIFAQKTDPESNLEPFPDGMKLDEMMTMVISDDLKKEAGGGDEDYIYETSADMKEYVAVQRIPNYGVHCYLALADQPLHKWGCDECHITRGPSKEGIGKPECSPQVPPDPNTRAKDCWKQFESDKVESRYLGPERGKTQKTYDDWTSFRCGQNDPEKPRLAGGGGGSGTGGSGTNFPAVPGTGTSRKPCAGRAINFSFPETESEIEDDYLVVEEDGVCPPPHPTISRLRKKSRTPSPSGAVSKASQRVVREENMVDARGNVIKATVMGTGVTGTLEDPRDNVTIRIRKTCAARDFDTPGPGKTCYVPQLPPRASRQSRNAELFKRFQQQQQDDSEYAICDNRPMQGPRGVGGRSPQRQQRRYEREEEPLCPCAEDDPDNDYVDYDTGR